jgi:hypothetical protein
MGKSNIADLGRVGLTGFAPTDSDRMSVWSYVAGLANRLLRRASSAPPRTGKIVIFDSPDGGTEIALIECDVDDVDAAINTQTSAGWHLADSYERKGNTMTLPFWRTKRPVQPTRH